MSERTKAEARRRAALGRAGEEAAAAFLEGKGATVVARNYHTPYGELDVVARDGATLVFAEVKAAGAGAAADPRLNFTPRKVERVFNAALYYLQKEQPGAEPDFRFDFLVVERRGDCWAVEHHAGVSLDQYLPSRPEAKEDDEP